jgi:ribosome-associated protein
VVEEMVSKTRRKREMHELQALGVALLQLSEAQLSDIEMPEALRAAILEGKRIKSHEAKRRHLQYIGRLMRDVDAAPIRARLAELEGHSAQAAARHRRRDAAGDRGQGGDPEDGRPAQAG